MSEFSPVVLLEAGHDRAPFDCGVEPLVGGPRLDWIICGGESGPSARPMHQDWARSLRDQSHAAAVPFFFKQWGEWAPCSQPSGHIESAVERCIDGAWMLRVGKKRAGTMLDGREWREMPR